MKLRLMTLTLLVALASAFVLAPLGAAPAVAAGGITKQITGAPVTNALGNTIGTFTGTLNITGFQNQGGRLVAVGTLSGQVVNAAGTVIQTLTNLPIVLPITGAHGSCQILTLDLGPLHLDLLGLVIDLSAVHLDIVAQAGAGNLLGNLLCAVANLLNGGGPLGGLASLLNNILRAL